MPVERRFLIWFSGLEIQNKFSRYTLMQQYQLNFQFPYLSTPADAAGRRPPLA